jgi:hypothetical protein
MKKKAKKVSNKKPVEQKPKNLVDKLATGSWIDKLTDSWGKPKSYNKDWNK